MKGIAGYGRYDSHPDVVGCPFARSFNTRCVAREGQMALSDDLDPVCRGCALTPEDLVEDLQEQGHDPAGELKAQGGFAQDLADRFAQMVREMTEPAGKGAGDD